MTAVFEQHELRFLYPENWRLAQNDETDDFVEISLESPAGCIWSVSLFPASAAPADLVESCARALSDQYEDFERIPFEGPFAGGQAVGFDSHFYCLDFLVTAQTRVIQAGNRVLNFFCQAESREFDKTSVVFEAITISLLNSIGQKETDADG